jgi:hypothetical protein
MTTNKNPTTTTFFNPATWPRVIFPRPAGTACALATCPRPRSLWQEIKKTCRHGGTFLEGSYYCQPRCLETALTVQLSTLRGLAPTMQPRNRIPLGLLMVARGKLTYPEVQTALEAQRRAGAGKIGEWIEKLGFASEQEVTKALALQWGCPVAASFDPAGHYSPGEIPLPILEAFQMLPLNYVLSTNTLYLAFGERVDHAALYAVEKILTCRTLPCVAGRESIAAQLEAMHQISHPADVEFGPMADLSEMGRIATSYVSRLNPAQVRLSRIGSFIWLRLVLDLNTDAAILRDAATQLKRGQRQGRSETRVLATNLIFSLPKESPRTIPLTRTFRGLYPVNPQQSM